MVGDACIAAGAAVHAPVGEILVAVVAAAAVAAAVLIVVVAAAGVSPVDCRWLSLLMLLLMSLLLGMKPPTSKFCVVLRPLLLLL